LSAIESHTFRGQSKAYCSAVAIQAQQSLIHTRIDSIRLFEKKNIVKKSSKKLSRTKRLTWSEIIDLSLESREMPYQREHKQDQTCGGSPPDDGITNQIEF
jgi:hypothetical protein